MKSYILILSLIICSCNTSSESEETVPIIVTKYDTDTAAMLNPYRTINYGCPYKVKKPYHLIQWNDGTYGILKYQEGEWYKVSGGVDSHEFTYIKKYATHFKDSCEAKGNLKQYLNSRVTYKIVK